MLRDLSYRYKVPLSFGFIILLTGAIVSTALLYRTAKTLEQTLIVNAQQLGEVLARSLGEQLQHDAVWNAYQLIRAPAKYTANRYLQPHDILVLDRNNAVFVSTDAQRFPLLAPLKSLGDEFQLLEVCSWPRTPTRTV